MKTSLRKIIVGKLLYHPIGYRLIQAYFNFIVPRIIELRSIISFYILKIPTNPKTILPILTFEPTNICNAKCNFCAYRKINDKKYIMDFDLFKKGLDQFISINGEQIWLTPTVGEAFMDKGLFEKITYAKEQGLTVKLFTNGTLLNVGNNYQKIVDSGIDELSISIGDINPKIEAQIYGVTEEVAQGKIQGILRLLDYNKQMAGIKKISLNFRSIRSPSEIINDPLFDPLKTKNQNFEFVYDFLLGYDNWGSDIKDDDLEGIMRLKSPIKFRRYPCVRLYNAVSILSNGDVRLCGCRLTKTVFDDLVVGNLHSQKLLTILQSEKTRNIRQRFEKNILPEVCKNCSFYEPFVNN